MQKSKRRKKTLQAPRQSKTVRRSTASPDRLSKSQKRKTYFATGTLPAFTVTSESGSMWRRITSLTWGCVRA